MGTLDDVGKKIKGKAQKVKGDFLIDTSAADDFGMKFKGGVSKLKGSFNDSLASARLRGRRSRRRLRRGPAL